MTQCITHTRVGLLLGGTCSFHCQLKPLLQYVHDPYKHLITPRDEITQALHNKIFPIECLIVYLQFSHTFPHKLPGLLGPFFKLAMLSNCSCLFLYLIIVIINLQDEILYAWLNLEKNPMFIFKCFLSIPDTVHVVVNKINIFVVIYLPVCSVCIHSDGLYHHAYNPFSPPDL